MNDLMALYRMMGGLQSNMRIYLAGPMRNKPFMNKEAFMQAEVMLEQFGHTIFNPARMDMERYGKDVFDNCPTGDIDQLVREKGFDMRRALADDCRVICETADAIAFLPGWENSSGCRAEHALGVALGLRLFYL